MAAGALIPIAVGALWLALGDRPDSPERKAPSGAAAAIPERPKRKRPLALPAGPDELALVAPLEVGAELAGWEVRFIGAVEEGRLRIALTREDERVRLDVVLASNDAPEPPAATRRFHIYYRAKNVGPTETARLSHALAEVLAKNGQVEPPSGMTTYEDAGRDPWADGI